MTRHRQHSSFLWRAQSQLIHRGEFGETLGHGGNQLIQKAVKLLLPCADSRVHLLHSKLFSSARGWLTKDLLTKRR